MSKKKADRLETLIIRNTVTIVTLLFMVIGAITVELTCWKVASAGTNLVILNYNAQCYNERIYKTDAMTDKYNEALSMRNTFYQSEDIVIRVFSNLPAFPKLCIWVFCGLLFILIPIITFCGCLKEITIERNFWKSEKRRWKRQDIREKRKQERIRRMEEATEQRNACIE